MTGIHAWNLGASVTHSHKPLATGENRLLAALPRKTQVDLLLHLEPVSLAFQESLYEPEAPIRHVYFPTSGMISLQLPLEDGSAFEVGRIGNEGVIGLPLLLGVRTSYTKAFVQIPGEALRMKAKVFSQLRKGGPLFDLLLRYTQALLHHVSQLTVCNNRHTVEQRLCRWLLITHDRVRADQFELTQEFLSQMLGAHRESITLAASSLQRAGIIRYSRGKLAILDRQGLEESSCECYRAIAGEFEKLFA